MSENISSDTITIRGTIARNFSPVNPSPDNRPLLVKFADAITLLSIVCRNISPGWEPDIGGNGYGNGGVVRFRWRYKRKRE